MQRGSRPVLPLFRAFAAMEGALAGRIGGEDARYMKAAINDLLESSECGSAARRISAQSNWASLQAAEKVTKSYILEAGGSHGKIHKLQQLCDSATALGRARAASAGSAADCGNSVQAPVRLTRTSSAGTRRSAHTTPPWRFVPRPPGTSGGARRWQASAGSISVSVPVRP